MLVFATKSKNNVAPLVISEEVNYVQLFFAIIILEFSHLDGKIIKTPHRIQIKIKSCCNLSMEIFLTERIAVKCILIKSTIMA